MRFVRYLGIGIAVLVVVAGAAVILALYNQARLVRILLARIGERTGYQIVASKSHLTFNSHLVLVLEHPRVFKDGLELAELKGIAAVVSYHSIFSARGLPLHALILEHPQIHLPPSIPAVSAETVPRITPVVVTRAAEVLSQLASVALRFDLDDGQVYGHRGRLLIGEFDVSARQQHRRPGRWPWQLNFDAGFQQPPLSGMRMAGALWLGNNLAAAPGVICKGNLWFWNFALRQSFNATVVNAELQGSARVTLWRNGELRGNTDLAATNIDVTGKWLTAPISPGDLSMVAGFDASSQKIALSPVKLTHGQEPIATATCTISSPYEPQRAASFSIGDVKISVADLKSYLRKIHYPPKALINIADSLTAGELTLSRAIFDSTTPISEWTPAIFRDSLQINASVSGLAFTLPPSSGLPPVTRAEAQLSYQDGGVHLRQGSADIGRSSLQDVETAVGLGPGLHRIDYRFDARADLDLGEIYPLAVRLLGKSERQRLQAVEYVRGGIRAKVTASGAITNLKPTPPSDYAVAADVRHVELAVRNAPAAWDIESGKIAARPGRITLTRLIAIPLNASASQSSVVVNGEITPRSPLPGFRHMTIELHQIPASHWLPLFVPPNQVAASGRIGGALTLNSSGPGLPTVKGKLTMDRGEVQFGFLRSPMVAQSATLSLDGKGLELAIPAAQLEGAPVSFKMKIADLAHPTMRIDASAQRLDFEVMRFIRLPWSPKTATHFFAIPAEGHIEALRANFDKLQMTNVSTDFRHDAATWSVYNFKADAIEGKIRLAISGRAADDWINMKGRLINMNAASLFLLSGARKSSPISGRLFATADLWADTGTDFFGTLAGTAAVYVRNGTLNKFTLLSRILSLIDLKNWLTANFPNPAEAGIPFKSVTADFKGDRGDFYTDNLKLEGPVIDIAAKGDIAFASGTMNMRIALIPFNTVNWLVNQIPVIGENLASGSNGLFAAYFQVTGPASDPHITPKPITSVAKFVAKTLSLPINIIKPNTIKP
jgi:hypothetical protein